MARSNNYLKMEDYWLSHVEASRRDALLSIVNCPDEDLHLLLEVVTNIGHSADLYTPILKDMLESYNFCRG